jgi:transposase-like protein
MSQKRRRRSPQFKAKLAIEALKGDESLSELANHHGVDPRQILRWRNQLIDECESLFVHKTTQRRAVADLEKDEIRRELNATLRNVEYLKKKLEK